MKGYDVNEKWKPSRRPLFHVFHYHVGNDSRDGRTHRCTKNLLIVGAVICKLRGFEAKRQQMNNILHRQRSSLSQGSIFSESLLRNLNGKINWDFSEERNNVERY